MSHHHGVVVLPDAPSFNQACLNETCACIQKLLNSKTLGKRRGEHQRRTKEKRSTLDVDEGEH